MEKEPLHRRLRDNRLHQIRAQQWFSAVKHQRCIGITRQKTVQDREIDTQIKRRCFVECNTGVSALAGSVHLPAAVGAAEVAVVGKDQVPVHTGSLQ